MPPPASVPIASTAASSSQQIAAARKVNFMHQRPNPIRHVGKPAGPPPPSTSAMGMPIGLATLAHTKAKDSGRPILQSEVERITIDQGDGFISVPAHSSLMYAQLTKAGLSDTLTTGHW